MNIKRMLALLSAVTLAASMFTACGDKEESSSEASTTESQEESTTEDTTEEETEAETEEETEEETSESQEEETEVSDDESSESSKAESTDGVTVSMDGSEATEENPVKFGEWASIGNYSATDETYHNVNVRITKVTTASEDQKYVDDAIELNNNCSSYRQIDVSELKIPSDCELCIVDYEVEVPENYPTNEWGITSPSMSLNVHNIGGGGIPSADGASTYIGLSSTTSLYTEEDPKYSVGNTYAFRCCFIMVKGYENYTFRISGYPEGTTDTAENRYDAYFESR